MHELDSYRLAGLRRGTTASLQQRRGQRLVQDRLDHEAQLGRAGHDVVAVADVCACRCAPWVRVRVRGRVRMRIRRSPLQHYRPIQRNSCTWTREQLFSFPQGPVKSTSPARSDTGPIVVSAAFPTVPRPLVEQLAPEVRLVQPVGRGGTRRWRCSPARAGGSRHLSRSGWLVAVEGRPGRWAMPGSASGRAAADRPARRARPHAGPDGSEILVTFNPTEPAPLVPYSSVSKRTAWSCP